MKQKSQYLQKPIMLSLYSTKQYIMKMIHLMTNLRLKFNYQKRMGGKIGEQNELLTTKFQNEIKN